MGKFAPVAPLEVVHILEEQEALGDYHLLLAHDVLANRREYEDTFANKKYTIIMDNSLIELGYPLPMKETLEAANIVGAQYFVLPDVLGDYHLTMTATVQALKEFDAIYCQKTFKESLELPSPVPVIQGANLEEMIKFIRTIDDMNTGYIEMLCVPRVIANQLGTRRDVVAACSNMGYNVHLLGFSDHKLDDIACARMPNVNGIDSAEPVRLGLKGFNMSLDFPKEPGPRLSYWDDPFKGMSNASKEMNSAMAAFNCNRYRSWIEPAKTTK